MAKQFDLFPELRREKYRYSSTIPRDRGSLPPYKWSRLVTCRQYSLPSFLDNTVSLHQPLAFSRVFSIGELRLSSEQKKMFETSVRNLVAESFKPVYRKKARLIVYEVLACFASGFSCLVSLDRNQKSYDLKIKVYRLLVDSGLAYLYKQPALKKNQGASSVLSASSDLLRSVNRMRPKASFRVPSIDLRLHRSSELKTFDDDGNEVVVPLPVKQIVRANDEVIYSHYDLASKFAPNVLIDGKRCFFPPLLTRKYIYDEFNGGRFYTWAQSIRKHERATLRFNQSESIELDYSAMHIGLLYSFEGLQVEHGTEYTVPNYSRDFIKGALLRLLNCKTEKTFLDIVRRSASQQEQERYEAMRQRRISALAKWKKTKRGQRPESAPKAFTPIPDTPADVNPKHLLEALKMKHKPVAHHFCTEHLGTRLQYLDSEIMMTVIQTLTTLGIPCIPVHDSVVVPKRDRQTVIEVMHYAYEEETGQKALIK